VRIAEKEKPQVKHIQKITVAKATSSLFECFDEFILTITTAFESLFDCLFAKDEEPVS
jgi:hypothetical protein